jgi:putative FmdB family regulatory protein
MPTYEYECTSCGHHIEVFQRIAEEPLTTCGVCGGALRKVFHPAGIVFKGSGFYATDSRSGSRSDSKREGEGGSSSSSDGGSKTSEGSSKASGDSSTGSQGGSSKESEGGSTSSKARESSPS